MVNNFEKNLKPSINKIKKYVAGKVINSKSKEIIKLSSNESPFKIPERVFTNINRTLRRSNFYPDGDCRNLKNVLAKHFKIISDQIICGNGSDDILAIICQAFARENSNVVCSEFGFTYYPIIARAAGAEVVFAKTKNMGINSQNILKKINSKTRLVFFANPNNPTGTIIMRKELKEFLESIPKDVIIVLDGAYSEYLKTKKYSDGLEFVNSFENLIVTRTFSKIFGLAGFRLGWAYSNKRIIELLEKIRGPFNVNNVAQEIGAKMLNEKKFLKNSIEHNEKWQKLLPKKINSFGLEAYETFTNFVLVRVEKNKFDKSKIIHGLNTNNIFVRELFNYNLPDYFRVSIGTESEMKKFLKVLETLTIDCKIK